MNRWIPLDSYHQKPKDGALYTITDGKRILHNMCLIDGGWYFIDDEHPTLIKTTHYLELKLP